MICMTNYARKRKGLRPYRARSRPGPLGLVQGQPTSSGATASPTPPVAARSLGGSRGHTRTASAGGPARTSPGAAPASAASARSSRPGCARRPPRGDPQRAVPRDRHRLPGRRARQTAIRRGSGSSISAGSAEPPLSIRPGRAVPGGLTFSMRANSTPRRVSMAEEPELDVLLGTEKTFPPPPGFAAEAEWRDPAVYERAAADPEAWWAGWAERLEWIEPWETVLDWSDPPHAKWFDGGKLNVSANCLDRHVAAGNGGRGRLPLGGRRRRRRSVTKAARRSPTTGCSTRPSASPTCSRAWASARATWSGSSCR